jgi:hypothetical protein
MDVVFSLEPEKGQAKVRDFEGALQGSHPPVACVQNSPAKIPRALPQGVGMGVL